SFAAAGRADRAQRSAEGSAASCRLVRRNRRVPITAVTTAPTMHSHPITSTTGDARKWMALAPAIANASAVRTYARSVRSFASTVRSFANRSRVELSSGIPESDQNRGRTVEAGDRIADVTSGGPRHPYYVTYVTRTQEASQPRPRSTCRGATDREVRDERRRS